jgi:hypothetical protein
MTAISRRRATTGESSVAAYGGRVAPILVPPSGARQATAKLLGIEVPETLLAPLDFQKELEIPPRLGPAAADAMHRGSDAPRPDGWKHSVR